MWCGENQKYVTEVEVKGENQAKSTVDSPWCIMCQSKYNFKQKQVGLDIDSLISVKCGEDEIIIEWTSTLLKNNLPLLEFMKWSHQAGLSAKKHSNSVNNQKNLTSTLIRVGVFQLDQLYLDGKENHKYVLFKKIIEEIALVMNMVIDYKPVVPYKVWTETDHKWRGLLGGLHNNEIDIAAEEMIMRSSRLDAFDYSIPVVDSESRLYIKTPKSKRSLWNAYIKVYNNKIWLAMCVIIIISSAIFTLAKKKHIEQEHPEYHDFMHDFLQVWGIFCQQGLAGNYLSYPVFKFANIVISLFSFIIISMYIGSLTSYMSVSLPSMPFTDLPSFIKDGTYKLTFLLMSKESLANSFNDINQFIKKVEDMPVTFNKGFEQPLCRTSPDIYPIHSYRNMKHYG
ncbi:uncharacterized protein LOC106643294 [Copidosoma floridanum]|uniref:uncharacterized protein LOC106643294 n=1 Tax=Copidosoma floridanum TaxID=29053 RepID=UPI0006C9A90B|nr:uncharacterized protein LOC106643294 [Copidosoma floridanum]